jgi:hypothetical protein
MQKSEWSFNYAHEHFLQLEILRARSSAEIIQTMGQIF